LENKGNESDSENDEMIDDINNKDILNKNKNCQSTGKKKRISYTLKQKITIVQDSQKSYLSLPEFSKSIGIAKSSLSEWRSQINELKKQAESSKRKLTNKRLIGGGRKILYPRIEKALYQWILEERKKYSQIT